MNKYFEGKKVLITGASGFVGRNLFEKMQEYGTNVVGTYFNKKIDGLTYCDLTDYDDVDDIMADVDYVFMIADKTYGAGTLKSNPASMVEDTICMNGNILKAAYKHKVKKVLFVSSCVVYQSSYKQLAEDDLDWNKDPHHVYMGVGWVKRYIEKLCEFYSQIGLPTVVVRPTNIYGKYDKYEEGKSHFVPAIIKRVLEEDSPITVWGTGYSVKDFIYIDDFIRDLLKVFVNTDKFDIFNLCSGVNLTIDEIVKEIIILIDHAKEIVYDPSKPDSIPFKNVNRNKLDSLYGKEYYTPLHKGLPEVIKWMTKELKTR